MCKPIHGYCAIYFYPGVNLVNSMRFDMIAFQLGYELPLSGVLGCWDTELNLRHWPTFFREHREVSDLFCKDLRSLKDESTTKNALNPSKIQSSGF